MAFSHLCFSENNMTSTFFVVKITKSKNKNPENVVPYIEKQCNRSLKNINYLKFQNLILAYKKLRKCL